MNLNDKTTEELTDLIVEANRIKLDREREISKNINKDKGNKFYKSRTSYKLVKTLDYKNAACIACFIVENDSDILTIDDTYDSHFDGLEEISKEEFGRIMDKWYFSWKNKILGN